MSGVHHNLLRDPLISVTRASGARDELSLPGVLEALGAGEDIEFSALRRHQHHAWFAFLVQVAAICAHRRGSEEVSLGADSWREALLDGAGCEEAWCLVVDDLSKPAFMQPPVPEGRVDVLKSEVTTPDALDVLLVTRNHDIKRMTMVRARPEHWVFALISLQTMQGFLGAGNYGISRMNGGFASRPCIAAAETDDWGRRFIREMRLVLDQRATLTDSPWPFLAASGKCLLWLEPWEGNVAIPLSQLDPLYVEICRRVRVLERGRLTACVGSTKTSRVDGKQRNGDTGDLWTPVARDSRKSLTVAADGFSYRLLHDLLLGADWIQAPAQAQPEDLKSLEIVARVLVRGQGETKGYHERIVPIPARARRFFLSAQGREELGRRARVMVELAANARRKVLRPAVLAFAQGGPESLNFTDNRLDESISVFDASVDECFFEQLFEDVDLAEESAQYAWECTLWRLVQHHYERLQTRAPVPLARRYRARAVADRVLYGAARKHLPNAFTHTQERAQDAATTD